MAIEPANQENEPYRSVVEDLTEVICRFRADDTILFVNEVYCRLFGKTREELVGRKWHPIVHPDDIVKIKARLKLLSPAKPVVVIENRVFDGAGQLRWMQFVNRAHYDKEGNLLEVQSVGRDITDRRLAEEALRDSEERYRRLFETETDAILMVDSESMSVIDVNLAACYMYGYTVEEFRSLKVKDISMEPEKSIVAIAERRRMISHRLHRKKNGTIFPVEISGSYFQSGGRDVHVAVIRDVSERISTEEALKTSEAKYRMLFENSLDAIFLTTPAGAIREANRAACEMFGMTEEELIRVGRGGIVDPADSRLAPALEERNATGRFFGELTFIRKDGSGFPAEVSSVILNNGVNAFVMLHDISERKRAEEELLERQKTINAMAMELSLAEERERQQIAEQLHDQVAPKLFLAKMKVHNLFDRLPPDRHGPVLEAIDSLIDLGVQDIRSLCLQLRPPMLAEMGLEASLRWLCEEFRESYGLLIDFEDDGGSKPLTIEMRTAIFQVVRELLLNIVKHAGTKSASLSILREDGMIMIKVEDSGIGFNADESSLATPRSGGFGIYSTRMKIEYLGGELKIDSAPGKGTGVTIKAPVDHSGRKEEESNEHKDTDR